MGATTSSYLYYTVDLLARACAGFGRVVSALEYYTLKIQPGVLCDHTVVRAFIPPDLRLGLTPPLGTSERKKSVENKVRSSSESWDRGYGGASEVLVRLHTLSSIRP